MKKYPPSKLATDVWQAIELLFRGQDLSCLPYGFAGDGIAPISIETSKRGIEVSGTIWFLGGGRADHKYNLLLCFSRSDFPSLERLTVAAIRTALIKEAWLDGKLLTVVVAGSQPSGMA